ncbi:uncharacterized protein VTP21DRAFT_1017 [Calcarisporiella thermophila]|uniref:uncharacterized protein n=1 Tax=Calcarisporiella thermophila TaxID=911321 RepID=UPI003742BD85
MSTPSVLVLGGVGFVGRQLVCHLVENNLARNIRVVDKSLPETSNFNERCKKAFEKVECIQGNLANPAFISKCYTQTDGKEFDIVFNLAAETRYSQNEKIYEEKVHQLSVNCAKEAAKRNVSVFLEMSTAEVYDSDKSLSKEDSKIKPWTMRAKYKHKAEEDLCKIEGLNLVVLRPAIIYGPGATSGLTPRLIIGRVYKKLGEEMKLLWTKDLRINTVHVVDVARACWHVAMWYIEKGKHEKIPIFNLADKSDLDQGKLNEMIERIFGIKSGFQGSVISNFALLHLESVTEDINEKHLAPWAELLKASNINSSPLTPYLDQEILYRNAMSVDGSLIAEETGFEYTVPEVTEEKLREIIDDYKTLGVWPNDDL